MNLVDPILVPAPQPQVTATPPRVERVLPTTVRATTASQTFTLRGEGFVPDMSLQIAWPGGGTTLTAPRLQWIDNQTIRVELRTGRSAAEWQLQLITPDGQRSNHIPLFIEEPATAGHIG